MLNQKLEAGLFATAEDLADALGSRPPWLSRLMSRMGKPSPKLALKLQEVAGIPFSAWYSRGHAFFVAQLPTQAPFA